MVSWLRRKILRLYRFAIVPCFFIPLFFYFVRQSVRLFACETIILLDCSPVSLFASYSHFFKFFKIFLRLRTNKNNNFAFCN